MEGMRPHVSVITPRLQSMSQGKEKALTSSLSRSVLENRENEGVGSSEKSQKGISGQYTVFIKLKVC